MPEPIVRPSAQMPATSTHPAIVLLRLSILAAPFAGARASERLTDLAIPYWGTRGGARGCKGVTIRSARLRRRGSPAMRRRASRKKADMGSYSASAQRLVDTMKAAALADPARGLAFQGAPGANSDLAAREDDAQALPLPCRTEERREGKECVSRCRPRGA